MPQHNELRQVCKPFSSSRRAYAYGLVVSGMLLLSASLGLAQAADCQDQGIRWSQDHLSKFDAAIGAWEQDFAKRHGSITQALHWAGDQLSEFEAAIASLERDVATRAADVRAKGEALLKEIRASRDAHRAEVKRLSVVRSAQAADASQSPEQISNAFWTKVNAYLDAVNADIATRQAAMQSRFVGN